MQTHRLARFAAARLFAIAGSRKMPILRPMNATRFEEFGISFRVRTAKTGGRYVSYLVCEKCGREAYWEGGAGGALNETIAIRRAKAMSLEHFNRYHARNVKSFKAAKKPR